MRFLVLVLLFVGGKAFADCETPWGTFLPDGADVIGFALEKVPKGAFCEDFSSTLICQGTFMVGGEMYPFENCDNFATCTQSVFGEIPHGDTVEFFKEDLVDDESQCEKELRQCNDGNLSGTFEHLSCRKIDP